MSFYQAMQLGAVSLKPMIKECSDKTLKRKYKKYFYKIRVEDFINKTQKSMYHNKEINKLY